MEFRHESDIRYHVTDVIRGFPVAASKTSLIVGQPEEDRQATVVEDAPDPVEGRTLVGYPVVFDSWTEIESWDGPFLERVAPGAADRTIAERASKIQLMFNHGFDFMLEQTPIGRYQSFEPDTYGVATVAALVDRGVYDKLDLVAELIRMGAIYGQSFRFEALSETWEDKPDPTDYNPKSLPERTINEFRWYESGPVTWPAYEATTVALRDGNPFAVRTRDEWKAWAEGRQVQPLDQLVEEARRRIVGPRALSMRIAEILDPTLATV